MFPSSILKTLAFFNKSSLISDIEGVVMNVCTFSLIASNNFSCLFFIQIRSAHHLIAIQDMFPFFLLDNFISASLSDNTILLC